jgi:hypothetical protein
VAEAGGGDVAAGVTTGGAGAAAGGDGSGSVDGAAVVDAGGVGAAVGAGAARLVSGGVGGSEKIPRLPTRNTPIDSAANRPITHPALIRTAPSLLPPSIVVANHA